MVIATSGDSVIQLHRGVATSARSAASALPVVSSEGMRSGHAGILENALAETRRTLTELARVADVGTQGAEALGEQDSESGRKFSAVQGGRRG